MNHTNMTDPTFRLKKIRDPHARNKQPDGFGGTLDSVHQTIVSSLRESSRKDELRAQYERARADLAALEQSTDFLDCLRAGQVRERMRGLEKDLQSADPVSSYFVKHADLMLEYYGNADRVQTIQTTPADAHTFLKFLAPTAPTDSSGLNKKQMYEEYMSRMKLHNSQEVREDLSSEHCSRCNRAREELAGDGILVCPSCGSEEYVLVVSDFPSFRDPPKERNNYAYKKINHLNEILNQFQAKESTIIPDEVMNEVVCEIKKRRIQNIAELTDRDMREILKKLNRSKYYEHAAHILSRLNGNPPPMITPEIEEKIRSMFQEIQAPFLLYCPNDRTNFLSYSYILYKFFELLDLDEYKAYFPLLKSRDRLISHDQIWKKICDYLKWEFIRSV
jgi:hypothetical protein